MSDIDGYKDHCQNVLHAALLYFLSSILVAMINKIIGIDSVGVFGLEHLC